MNRRTVLACVVALGLTGSVASAETVLDLTTAGATATGTAAVGGTFQVDQISPQSTGTGVIDPFLRIQANGNQDGWNTSNSPVPLDDKSGIWTHALLLSSIPVFTIGGVEYYQFMLDINQSNPSLLSLNQIQIFQSNTDPTAASGNDPSDTAPVLTLAGANQVFEMNTAAMFTANTDTTILMDYALNSGSGSGDMFLYVRKSNFDQSLTYVILYSQFGNPPGSQSSNDGFEEWAVIGQGGGGAGQTLVPEPASLLLLGTGLGLIARRGRRGKKQAAR